MQRIRSLIEVPGTILRFLYKSFAILVPGTILLITPAFADIVYYKSGDLAKGVVVEEHRDRVVLNTEGGEQTIFREDIDEIFFPDPERNYLYLGNEALDRGDFNAARGFFQKALQILPDLEETQDGLKRLEDLQGKKGIPPEAGSLTVLLEKQWGLVLEIEEGWPVVKAVKADSLENTAGIVLEDRLVSLWGSSFRYLPAGEVAQALLGPADSGVKVTLQREIVLPASSSENRSKSLVLDMKHLGLTVTAVESGSPASLSGLLPQDRIVSINGQSTRYLPLDKAKQMILQAKKPEVSLLIHRDLMVKRR